MHIVIIGWLYVIGMMALAADSAWSGLLLFGGVGLAPVLLILLLLARRARARSVSMREPQVRAADDTQSEPDQH